MRSVTGGVFALDEVATSGQEPPPPSDAAALRKPSREARHQKTRQNFWHGDERGLMTPRANMVVRLLGIGVLGAICLILSVLAEEDHRWLFGVGAVVLIAVSAGAGYGV